MEPIISDMKQDELRDKIYHFWSKYKNIIGIVIVAIIVISFSTSFYLNYREENKAKEAYTYFKLINKLMISGKAGKFDNEVKKKLLKKVNKGKDIYSLLALSTLINIKAVELSKAENWEKTVIKNELFKFLDILKNKKFPNHDYNVLRMLCLSRIDILMGFASLKNKIKAPNTSIKELEELVKFDSIFVGLLKENLAIRLIYANNFDRKKIAKTKAKKLLLEVIKKKDTTILVRERCRAYLQYLGEIKGLEI